MAKQPCIHVGTSGWHYRHWVGPFYPMGTRPGAFLDYYARHFATAEINNSFYKLPKPEMLAAWRDQTPGGFIFACKGSRFTTHMKKLKDPKESARLFFDVIEALEDKTGPILFQLPPRWQVNIERLRAFLDALPQKHRYAFEFRDESWFAPEVYDALAKRGAAFCLYDLAGRQSPIEVTADFIYVRLHGPGGAYHGSYDDRALAAWTKRFLAWRKAGKEVYCYFDNDEKGYAAQDAKRLRDRIRASARRTSPSTDARRR